MLVRLRQIVTAPVAMLALVAAALVPLPSQAATAQGTLDPVATIWPSAASFPEELTVVGEDLYFFAETAAEGYELYRYRDGQLRMFDATPGVENTPYSSLFQHRNGLAAVTWVGSDFRFGYLEGETISWISAADLSFTPGETHDSVVGLGDRIYAVDDNDDSLLWSLKFGVAGYDERSEDYALNIFGTPLANSDIVSIIKIMPLGNLLIAKIRVSIAGQDESLFFQLDTTAETPVWNAISAATTADVSFVDGDFLYLAYDDPAVEKYRYVAGSLVQQEIQTGQNSIAAPAEVLEIIADSGELFISTLDRLYWLSSSGWVEVEDESGNFVRGFELANLSNGLEVIDEVAYLAYGAQLMAWDYQENIAWSAYQAVSSFGQTYPQYIVALGKTLAFQAESEGGDELVLFDTLTDTHEVVDINPGNESNYPYTMTSFDGSLYFLAQSPDSFVSTMYMEYDGESVSPVTDLNGNPLQFDALEKTMLVIGGNLYLLAFDTSKDEPFVERDSSDLILWRISAAGTPPEPLEWLNKPNASWGALRPLGNSLLIEFDDQTWVFDPSDDSYTEVSNNGIYSDFTYYFEPPVLDGAHYLIQNPYPSSDLSIREKLARLDGTQMVTENIKTWVDGNGASGALTAAQQADIRFQRLVPGPDDSVIYGLANGTPAGGWAVVAITRDDNGNLTARLVAVAGNGLYIRHIYSVDILGVGKTLLIHYADSQTTEGGGIVEVPIQNGIPAAFEVNTNTPGQLTDDGTALEFDNNSLLDDSGRYLLATAKESGGEFKHLLFDFADIENPISLAGATRSAVTVNFDPGNLVGHGGALYLGSGPANGADAYDLYRFTLTGGPTLNFSSPLTDNFDPYDAIQSRVVDRPAGTAKNLVLKSNYVGGASDVVMRSRTSGAIDDAAFSRDGYSLAGWATTSSGQVAYQPSGTFPFQSSSTLYAIWNQDSAPAPQPDPDPAQPPPSSGGSSAPSMATVSFVTDVGTTALNSLRVSAGSQIVLPKLAKQNHEFLGWSETPNGLLVGQAYRPASSVQLHPVFKPLEVKLFFSLPAGAKGVSSMVWRGDQDLVLPRPTMAGKTFVAWVNAENGERITSDWVPTEPIMLAPLFREGSADHVVNFWRNSSWVTNTQLSRLTNLVRDSAILNGRRTIVITGFDERDEKLARKRALNTAIKLRKLGVKDAIELQGVVQVGSKPRAELTIN